MAEVSIRLGHRHTAGEAHRIAEQLLSMLKTTVNGPELFERVRVALECGEAPTLEQRKDMHEMVALTASLPQRVKTLKDLVEALARVIAIERTAFGLDTAAGTEGRPMVIVKDYTGRGSFESPVREASA
jgi:hypothetical protein